MSHRRSERLRRKRDTTTPGLSQPGSYSLHADGYTVESEASFLPPPSAPPSAPAPAPPANGDTSAPAPASRRERYRHAPHSFTVEDSPVIPDRTLSARTPPASNKSEDADDYARTPDAPVASVSASAVTSEQLHRVVATPTDAPIAAAALPSLFRTPTTPHAVPMDIDTPPVTPAGAGPGTGPGAVGATPPLQRRKRADTTKRVMNDLRTSLTDILSSATRRPVNPRWRPPASAHPTAGPARYSPRGASPYVPSAPVMRVMPILDDDVVPSDDDDGGDPGAAAPGARSALMPPSPAVVVLALVRRGRKLSPLALLLPAFVLGLVVLLSLDAAVSSRDATRTPAWQRAETFCRTAVPTSIHDRVARMSAASALLLSSPSVAVARAVTSRFFRSPWPLRLRSKTVIDAADVVTRAELEAEILPRVIAAARTAANQEAERAAREAREARDAADRSAAAAAAAVATAVPVPPSDDEFAQFVERYAADKDLPADFALASAGGAVVATDPSGLSLWTRYARQYAVALVSDRRFTPMWPQPPSIVLTPDVLPGNCWAFDGNTGSLTVRLARPVAVSAVTIEHTPRRSVFSIASAMRRFRVVGLPVRDEVAEVSMGEFMFDLEGDRRRHLQTFDVDSMDTVLRAVRVEVVTNHGANHTAIYRIRVHGEEDMSPFLDDTFAVDSDVDEEREREL